MTPRLASSAQTPTQNFAPSVAATPDPQRVDVDDRVDLLEGAGLPGRDLLEHRVSDLTDRVVAQLGAQRPLQMGLDVADRHPARVERDAHVIEATEAALPLGTSRGSKVLLRSRGTARPSDPTSSDRLRGEAVAAVRAAAIGRVAAVVAQVLRSTRPAARARRAS